MQSWLGDVVATMVSADFLILPCTRNVKAATKVREIENADYTAAHKDYSESIDALGRAINVLKKESHDRKQAGAALLEVSAFLPKEAQRTIASFLQTSDPNDDLGYASQLQQDGAAFLSTEEGAPEANAYEFQSQGIVDMLQKLLDKFGEELDKLEKEEKMVEKTKRHLEKEERKESYR